MKYKIRTEEIVFRTYEIEADNFRDAFLNLSSLLKEETIWTRNPKLDPIDELKIPERILKYRKNNLQKS